MPTDDDPLAALARDEPFLRQLALRLAGDPGAADDLVQETWLRAFTLRPAVGDGLAGWGAAVMRRLAARQRRATARRTSREARAARPERIDDPLEAVQRRLDAQATLVSALRRLSPEQREALVLRHAEELSVADIAARQGTSIANVKARLARGLAALRADLDQRAGGERGSHAIVLGPLIAPQLWRGRNLAAGTSTLTVAGGVLLMGNVIKLALVAAALVAVALLVRRPDVGPRATDVATPVETSGAVELASTEALPALERPSATSERIEVEQASTQAPLSSTPAMPRELCVRVKGPGPRKTKVDVYSMSGGSEGGGLRTELEVDTPGEARCSLEPIVAPLSTGGVVRALLFKAYTPGCLPTVVEVPFDPRTCAQTLEVELTVRETATITGIVATRSERVHVSAYALQSGDRLGRLIGNSSRVGAFPLQVDHAGEVALLVVSADHQPATIRCWVTRGQVTDVGSIELAPAVAIEGRVLVAGAPAPGTLVRAARVEASPLVGGGWERTLARAHGAPTAVTWLEGAFVVAECESTSGSDGTFRFGALTPGAYALSVIGPAAARSSWGARPESVTIIAPAEGIRLESGWAELRLEFDVPPLFDGVGTLLLGEPGWTPQGIGLSQETLHPDYVLVVAIRPGVVIEARVEFAGFENVVHEVSAERAGDVLRRTVQLRRPAGTTQLFLELQGAPVHDGMQFLLLLEQQQKSPDDPGAALLPEGEPRIGVLRQGRVVFEGVPSTARTLLLVPGGTASSRIGDLADVTFEVELPRDGEHLQVVRLERGTLLRVRALAGDGTPVDARARVLDAAGHHLATLFVTHGAGGATSTSTWGLDANAAGDGWNSVVPNLPPGDYVLQVELEGQARRDLPMRLATGVLNEVTAQF